MQAIFLVAVALDSSILKSYVSKVMISSNRKAILSIFILLFGGTASMAIEGQDPTPRFFPPDFSVEEEKVTYPGDLLEFFRAPFVEYLRSDTARVIFVPKLAVNSAQEARGNIEFAPTGFFATASGEQKYFGDGKFRKLMRIINSSGGYGDFLLDKYPVAITADGHYSTFRGEYEPSDYFLNATAEGHIPIGKSLLSLSLKAGRESWKQMPGPFPRIEENTDKWRSVISNFVSGEAVFRSIPSEYTGIEVAASGVRSVRFRENRWERIRKVESARGALVYDSTPLRIAIGGAIHRTWAETMVSPNMDFDLLLRGANIHAKVRGYIVPLERRNAISSPKIALPPNAEYLTVPISIEAGGRIELKPKQFLSAKASYSRAEKEPVVWEPMAEAPAVSLEETKHQGLSASLSNDFGALKNVITIGFFSDKVFDKHIPTIPSEVVADTVTLEYRSFGLFAGGYREFGQPYIEKPYANNVAIGMEYRYKFADFRLTVENIFANALYDPLAMEFSDDVKFWARIGFRF